MDTKWNNTEHPAVIEGLPLRTGGQKRGGRARAVIGCLAFFLGVTLTAYSAGNAGSRIFWDRDLFPRWTDDWQETENFRQEVSAVLKDFLTIGAGGKLDFYDYSYWEEYEIGRAHV